MLAPLAAPPLFDFLPGLRERVPHLSLGRFPTRIHPLTGLGEATSPSAGIDLWIKRDDESGALYGGNKVRKLEFLLAEARARGQKRVVTTGAWGSHHVLATGVYGEIVGLPVEAVVVPQPMEEPFGEHVRENLLAGAACKIQYVPAGNYAAAAIHIALLRARRHTAWIAPGGSSPTGSLGYVSAGLELAEQIRAGACPAFDDIYVALGSSGTAAGLWVGLRLGGVAARLVAVRVVDRPYCNRGTLLRLARATARRLGVADRLPRRPTPADVVVEHAQFGAGYAVPTADGRAALALAAAAGLHVETTYTAKTLAAVLADARAGRLAGRRVLYWHTYNSVDLAPLLARSPGPSVLPHPLVDLFAAR